LNRRDFLKSIIGSSGLLSALSRKSAISETTAKGILVNDTHTQLNPTYVDQIIYPNSVDTVQNIIHNASRKGNKICIAGARHAMGAQQFATDGILIDTTTLSHVLTFNPENGTIEVEAGMRWPQVIGYLLEAQKGEKMQLGIAQKQTADWLSVGGSLGSNIHGRGLKMKPFIQDIESFELIDSNGEVHKCSRKENPELFGLAIGGYGLLGIVYSVELRLVPRQKVERISKILSVEDLMPAYEKVIADGFLYGQFLYDADPKSKDFLRKGISVCYRPVDTNKSVPDYQEQTSAEKWINLRFLAHAKKEEFFRKVSDYYMSTSGNVYWSDTHQMGLYIYNYHKQLDQMLGSQQASDIPAEVYVPKERLVDIISEMREDFRKNNVDLIFGNIGVIEEDDESFLSYAKKPYSTISFHIHTVHSPDGLKSSSEAHRRVIDMAIKRGGSYYLTNHKLATPAQLKACYPQFPEFLRLKKKYDPKELFQSDWYRYYKKVNADL
jgi:FAD/FMN-containing dehydrogenase